MPEAPYSRSIRWLTVILINPEEFGVDREYVRLVLEAEDIESRPLWKPMHLQPVFKTGEQGHKSKNQPSKPGLHYPARVVGGAVSEYLFERGLCLPSGTQLTENDLDRIVKIIKRAHDRSG